MGTLILLIFGESGRDMKRRGEEVKLQINDKEVTILEEKNPFITVQAGDEVPSRLLKS